MKIIKHGKDLSKKKLRGECTNCGCKVECVKAETKTLIDRDTQSGMATQYVRCPDCGYTFLWVK